MKGLSCDDGRILKGGMKSLTIASGKVILPEGAVFVYLEKSGEQKLIQNTAPVELERCF